MTTLTTPAAPAITPEVVGKAVYLELKPVLDEEGKSVSYYGGSKGEAIKQLIVFPSGLTPEGHNVAPTIYERVVSPAYPRSQWSNSTIRPSASREEFKDKGEESFRGLTLNDFPSEAEVRTLGSEAKEALYLNGIEQLLFKEILEERSFFDIEENTYKSKPVHAWTISTKFAVEVTDKDLLDVKSWKTPQAVIRRITKARVAAGLPEKLV